MRRSRTGSILMAAGLFMLLSASSGTAHADTFCPANCRGDCEAGDTDCFKDCCEDVCDEAFDRCRNSVKRDRSGSKKQCQATRAQGRIDCDNARKEDLEDCGMLECLNDPNQSARDCRREAKAARDQCKDLTDNGRELCRAQVRADRDSGEAQCEIEELGCIAICLSPSGS